MSKCLSLVVKTQTSSKDKYSTSAFQTLAVLLAPLNKYLYFFVCVASEGLYYSLHIFMLDNDNTDREGVVVNF